MNALVLSYALDTNGQNTRYVRAAERWGNDPDVLKAFAAGNYDPAYVVGRFSMAADKLGGVAIRSAHRSKHLYQAFDPDIFWDRSTDAEVRRLAGEADVIHLNNSWRAYKTLRLHKPALLHHHGSLFRSNPPALLHAARRYGFVQAVSTIDLLRHAPDVLTWLPTAYDIDALQAFGEAHRREPDGRIRIVSAPTNRMWKSTDALEMAVRLLQLEGLPVDLILVENKTWAECMAIKATADIYFDQVILGYGCNAIEAWGMGIPVIAGADEWTLARMRHEFNGDLPFYEATPDTIVDSIRAMVESKSLRFDYAVKGLAHVRRFHDERPALTKLVELYVRAMAVRTAPIPAPRPHPGQSWGQIAEEARARRIAARQKATA